MKTEHRKGQLLTSLLSFQALIVMEWGGLSTWQWIIGPGGARWHGLWGRSWNICDSPIQAVMNLFKSLGCPNLEKIKIKERRILGKWFGIQALQLMCWCKSSLSEILLHQWENANNAQLTMLWWDLAEEYVESTSYAGHHKVLVDSHAKWHLNCPAY